MRKAHDELEKRVEERTADLAKANEVLQAEITERKRTEETLRKSLEREARAYAQGRLEIVDTILHNIGNAINNVTIGISTIQETLANSKLTRRLLSLGNAIKEHQDNFADYIKNDQQGQKVAPFIIALANDFVKQDEELAKIVNRVQDRARYIADIVRTERMLDRNSIYTKSEIRNLPNSRRSERRLSNKVALRCRKLND